MFPSEDQKKVSKVVFGIYLGLLTWLILFKFSVDFSSLHHVRSIDLVPFRGIKIVNGRADLSEVIYNILVFIPLGMFVSIFKSQWRFWQKALPGLCLSLTYELTQFVFGIGFTDITDLLGNTLGGVLGILLFMLLRWLFKEKTVTVVNVAGLAIESVALVLLAVLTLGNL